MIFLRILIFSKNNDFGLKKLIKIMQNNFLFKDIYQIFNYTFLFFLMKLKNFFIKKNSKFFKSAEPK